MSTSLEKFMRTAKVFYEDIKNELSGGQQGIDSFLFGVDDQSTSSNFTLDQYISNPHGIVFRKRDEQSHARPYVPGVGQVYEVPRASEKTYISEELRDSVVAGVESTAGFSSHNAQLLEKIIRDHVVGHTVTRWKLAIDTIRTGKYSPTGAGGQDIGLEIDFNRDAAQSIIYDFTETGATIDAALKAMYDRGNAKGMSKGNRVMILGSKWLEEFETDDNVLERMQANPSNVLVEQNIMPPELQNTKGLYVVGRYRIPGTVGPVWITAFNPDSAYIQYKGATATDFMPEDEAIMVGLDSGRFRIFRGVDALDGSGNITRSVGEIVLDSFVSKDPVGEVLRSQSRVAMIPGDVDKTVRSEGTFPVAS